MHGYSNCYYSNKERKIYLKTWNDEGEPIIQEHDFSPYLFVKSPTPTEYTSMYGESLQKKSFPNNWERTKFVDSTSTNIYYNHQPEQQFLLDHYRHGDFESLLNNPVRTFFIDIEVYSPHEFPKPEEARHPINSIALYDTIRKKYTVFSTKNYNIYAIKDYVKDIDPLDIEYLRCKDEEAIFRNFMKYWRKHSPDIIATWNGFSFDLPYIINRSKSVIGEDWYKRFSPYDTVTFKDVFNKKYGTTYTEYQIKGCTHIDLMVLYQLIVTNTSDSYSLNAIAEDELEGVGKVDMGGLELYELFDAHFDKFISYNIQDVNIMLLLDNKLNLLQLTRFLTTMGFTNMDKVYGKVSFISGMFSRRLLEKNLYTITKKPEKDVIPISGGFVREPLLGLKKDVIYFDANSLYPNTIITLNISPETKRGEVHREGEYFVVGDEKYTRQEFAEYCRANKLTCSGSGHLFDTTTKGILPSFCEYLIEKRVYHKKQMLSYERDVEANKHDEELYKKYKSYAITQNVLQSTYKVVLNSTYGVLLNQYFPIYDRACGLSITRSGQNIIKRSFDILNKYMDEQIGVSKDRVVCGDTDSVAIDVNDLLNHRGISIYDDNHYINNNCKDLDAELSNVLNSGIAKFVKNTMFSNHITFYFKRETVCKTALFMAKKNYGLYYVNKEGVDTKKVMIKGNLIKSEKSQKIRALARTLINGLLIEGWGYDSVYAFYMSIVDGEDLLSIDDLSSRQNVKALNVYKDAYKDGIFRKGTPFACKAALAYNHLVDTLRLPYKRIESGNKVKVVKIKPNRWGFERIAYPDNFPAIDGIEYDKIEMMKNNVDKFLSRVFISMNWDKPNCEKLVKYNLNDLFE